MFTPVDGMATEASVAAAWVAQYTALPVGDVLPSTTNIPTGFVKYQVIATSLDPSMGAVASRWSRVQYDVYFSGATEYPNWLDADQNAEAIARGIPYLATQIIPGFGAAIINEARIVDGPVRAYGDTSSLARVTLDAMINWTPTI